MKCSNFVQDQGYNLLRTTISTSHDIFCHKRWSQYKCITKDDLSTNVWQTCLGYLGYGEENKDIISCDESVKDDDLLSVVESKDDLFSIGENNEDDIISMEESAKDEDFDDKSVDLDDKSSMIDSSDVGKELSLPHRRNISQITTHFTLFSWLAHFLPFEFNHLHICDACIELCMANAIQNYTFL